MDSNRKWLILPFILIPVLIYLIAKFYFTDITGGTVRAIDYTIFFSIPALTGYVSLLCISNRKPKRTHYWILFPWLTYLVVHILVLIIVSSLNKSNGLQPIYGFAQLLVLASSYGLFLFFPILLCAASLGGIIGGLLRTYLIKPKAKQLPEK